MFPHIAEPPLQGPWPRPRVVRVHRFPNIKFDRFSGVSNVTNRPFERFPRVSNVTNGPFERFPRVSNVTNGPFEKVT